jgi:hypothetical protein
MLMGGYGQAVCPMWQNNLESVIIMKQQNGKRKKNSPHILESRSTRQTPTNF